MVYFPFHPLAINFSASCTIELEDKVIVTGGVPSPEMSKKVVEYNAYGWVKDLPDLNEERDFHGCGHYVDNNNNMVNIAFQNHLESIKLITDNVLPLHRE